MKYLKLENLNNPFKIYRKGEEPKSNKFGHTFMNENLIRRKVAVVAVFENLQEFKGFVSYMRNEIIKNAKPCDGNYYFLKMRKEYEKSTEDYGLYVFDSVAAAEEVKEYLLTKTNVFKDADIIVVDKDDNEIGPEDEKE